MRPGDLLEQRYRLVRVLGRGRSGSVWCARNELIDRAVAIKILHRSLASEPERLQRFFQEARACGRVRHPAVVEVLDLGQGDDGVLFLVMELLEGETLSSLLARRGRLGTDEALSIVIPLARGLAAAHAHGILHRDLKPANIYLHKTPTGGLQPKILDFGISKILGNDLTQSGVVLGTPSYMSPEQARGVPDLDPRMDVWSLGVILFECLTGRLPFLAREYRALVEEILERKHSPVDQIAPDTPKDLSRLVDEALEKQRDRRVSSAAALAQKLTSLLRARGGADLLREPEDEFSDGAPTLARDRDPLTGHPIDDTVGDNTMKAVQPQGAKPPAETPPPTPAAKPLLRPGNASSKSTPIVAQPSALTAAIAAQTSGGKRASAIAVPRPAAGTPARKTGITGEHVAAAVAVEADRLRAESRPESKDVRTATLGWEMNIAKAASGRDIREDSTARPAPITEAQAATILGSGATNSSTGSGLSSGAIRVDEHWDTTVADVSREALEASGSAPESAHASLPKLDPAKPLKVEVQPEAAKAVTPKSGAAAPKPALADDDLDGEDPTEVVDRPRIDAALSPQKAATPATLGAIPGFTAAPANGSKRTITSGAARAAATPIQKVKTRTVPPPPVKKSSTPPPPPMRSATPPPPAVAAAPTNVDASKVPTKRPPRPPPKTIPPGAGVSKATMRPPVDGFAAPAPPSAPPPRRSAPPPRPNAGRSAPPPDAPLIAPEIFALQQDVGVFDLMAESRPAPEVEATAPASSDRSSIPAIGPATSVEDTDRRTRNAAAPIVPFFAAAAAVLFVVGAVLGTVAARSGKTEHGVRRFCNAQAVIISLRMRELEVAQLEASRVEALAKAKAADDAKLKADDDAKVIADAAAAKLKADQDALAAAAAAASASADADASASAAAAPKPVPVPVATPKPKPKPLTTTVKPKPVTKPTTPTKTPTKKPATTTDSGKKKSGEKEWWEKKF